MNNAPTGKTRLKPGTTGCGWFKTKILIHQTELEYDHMTNAGGMIDIERETGWFNTKPEWLLEIQNESRKD